MYRFNRIISLVMSFIIAVSFICLPITDGLALTAYADKVYMPYYYSLLSEEEQEYYSAMQEAIIAQKSSVKIDSRISEETLKKLVDLLYYQDIQAFNLSDCSAMMYSRRTEIKFQYRYSKANADKIKSAMEKKADKLISAFDEDTKIYTKICMIHDYITKYTVYDKEKSYSDLAYGALVKRRAKCDGYSQAFAYLCAKAGIKTVNVIGETDGTLHMWNKVRYNKKWYNVDVTWDDPESNYKENRTYGYFMLSDEEMSAHHKETVTYFKSPKAADSSIGYYEVANRVAADLNEAKTLSVSVISKAANSKKMSAAIQFETKAAYDEFNQRLSESIGNFAYEIFNSALKKSNNKFSTQLFLWSIDEHALTITFHILYPGKSLSDYYVDVSRVSSDYKKALDSIGIS